MCQADSHIDRQTCRRIYSLKEINRQTEERYTVRLKDIQTDILTHTHIHRQTYTELLKQKYILRYRHTHKQANRYTYRQTDRGSQTDRQICKPADRQTSNEADWQATRNGKAKPFQTLRITFLLSPSRPISWGCTDARPRLRHEPWTNLLRYGQLRLCVIGTRTLNQPPNIRDP